MGNEYHVAMACRDSQYKPGSVVLVTGASSGLGREIALVYAERGAKLVLVARDQTRLKEVEKESRARGASQILCLRTDVGDEGQVRQCLKRVEEQMGGLDVLVLNAGVNAHVRFQEVENLSLLDDLLRVNLKGYVNFAKHGLGLLRASGGNMVVISSMSGEVGLADRTLYCASKFAVNGFFEALSKQVPVPITVVSLPSIDTPMRDHDLLKQKHGSGSVVQHGPGKKPSLGPEECARVIAEMSDRRVEKVVFPLKAYLGVKLRPFLRKTVDYFIDRSAKL